MMMGYYGGGPGFGWLGMLFGMLMNLAFAAVLVLGAIWLYKNVMRGKNGQEDRDAMAILKRRYAQGEITSEEYHRMKKELE